MGEETFDERVKRLIEENRDVLDRLADNDDREGHSLRLPFDSDDPAFARGFEAGRLWAVMEHAPHLLDEQVIHASNAEMVLRMAEAVGATCLRAEHTEDEDWMVLLLDVREAKP